MIKSRAVYIHIPFCKKICPYCDFCKVFYDADLVNQYLDALNQEILSNSIKEPCRSIYIGGGTPSCLSNTLLEKLFQIVRQIPTDGQTEYTIECNILDLEEDKIHIFKKYGINRVSVGVESNILKLQKKLNRIVPRKVLEEKIKLLKKNGIQNINVDLMYAIENETLEDLKEDIAFFLKLDTTHISTYSLMIEPHTKFYIQNQKEIDEEEDAKMYELICKTLKENGYQHYEVSNFAKPSFQSIHNLTYWDNEEYYGFGVGAHFYLDGVRGYHKRNIYAYINGCEELGKDKITKEDEMDYFLLLGLRKSKGISKKKFQEQYGLSLQDVYDFSSFIKKGIIIENGDYFSLADAYFYVMNEVLVELLCTKKL